MAELKTKPNNKKVQDFIQAIDNDKKKADSRVILKMMGEITGEKPVMWGDSIIGFGNYHYRYKSGREGDWFVTGFSPRKQNLTLYLNYGFEGQKDILSRLGKHKTGKACLYINKLEDVDLHVLKELIQDSVAKGKPCGI